MSSNTLNQALDIAAPNKEMWLAGLEAFGDTVKENGNLEEAYYAALDAAAPDEESWIAGRDLLVVTGALELPSDTPLATQLRLKAVSAANRTKDSIKSLVTRTQRSKNKEEL